MEMLGYELNKTKNLKMKDKTFNKIYLSLVILMGLIVLSIISIDVNKSLRDNRCDKLQVVQQNYFDNPNLGIPKDDIFDYSSCFTHNAFDLTPFYNVKDLSTNQVMGYLNNK